MPAFEACSARLLSLLSMAPLACLPGDRGEGDGEGDAATRDDTTSASSTADGDGSTTETTETAPGGSSTTAADSADSTSGGPGEELECDDPIPVAEISDACVAYTASANICYHDGMLSADCIEYFESICEYYLGLYALNGPDCRLAFEDYYVCLSMTPCEEIATACPREEAVIASAC